MILSSSLRFYSQILKKDGTTDAFNNETHSYVEHALRYCDIRPVDAEEKVAAEGENTKVKVTIHYRYEAGLLRHDDRIVDLSRGSPGDIYEVTSPPKNVGQRYDELMVEAELRNPR